MSQENIKVDRSNAGLYTVLIVFGFAYFNVKLFGLNDFLALGFVLFTSIFVFISILDLRMGARNALKVYFNEGSLFHNFFSRKHTFLQILISAILAVVFSIVFVVILKGLTITHGMGVTLLLLTGSIFILQFLMNPNTVKKSVSENLNHSVNNYATEFLTIFVMAFWLSLFLALILASKETYDFLTIDIRLDNFISSIEHKAIPWTENNAYSRVLVNFYLIMQSFKFALANEVMFAYGFDLGQKSSIFYYLVAFITIMNFLKLFGFSITLVLLLRAVQKTILPRLLFVTNLLDKALEKPKTILYKFIIVRYRWLRRFLTVTVDNFSNKKDIKKSTPEKQDD